MTTEAVQNDPATRSESNEVRRHQGPTFPYRFSIDTALLRRHAPHIKCWEIFCRWSVGLHGERHRALEWCNHGKGKGVTALPSDQPERCCGDATPTMMLIKTNDQLTREMAPGMVYTGIITGRGWYSAPPGTEFLLRIVINPEDVELLRAEAAVYELYESVCANPETPKTKYSIPPLEFHGFFQNGCGNAAMIVLKASDKKIRKRRVGKGRRTS